MRWSSVLRSGLLVIAGVVMVAGVVWTVDRSEGDPVMWPGQLATMWLALKYIGVAAAASVALLLIAAVVEDRRRQ
jgi:hypothetical protein